MLPMNHLPRFFSTGVAMGSKKSRRRKPRLERRNASKDIEYDASSFYSSIDDSFSSSSPILTRSLDIYDKTSFRIEGTDGELDRIYRCLGFSGPEDFSIPTAAWEGHEIRSSSDVLPRSRLNRLHSPKEETDRVMDGAEETVAELSDKLSATGLTGDGSSELKLKASCVSYVGGGGRNSGIKGARPPFLNPPPGSKLHVIDNGCSSWDLLRDFSPEDDRGCVVPDNLHSSEYEEYKREEGGVNEEDDKEEKNLMRIGETAMLSSSTSNDDDSSSSTTEPMSNISPNGRFKRTITYWQKGDLLGRGSFGSVYEGISD